MSAFEEMGVMPEIAKAVEDMGWNLPTDVQAEAIPLILGGGDVLMAAETGSGKTGAFCLPVAQIVWETLRDELEPKKRGQVNSAAVRRWVFSSKDRSADLAVTPDGLRCQSRDLKVWNGARATTGVFGKGKFYFEAYVMDEGLCRVGWATDAASYDLGTDAYGFGFGGTGRKSNCRQFDPFGSAFGKSDVIGCWLDLDNQTIGFSKNETDYGTAFAIPRSLQRSTFFPAVVLKNADMSFNLGATPFRFPKSGFQPICQATNTMDNPHENAVVALNKRENHEPLALVLEPSRELAEQTNRQIQLFTKKLQSPSISTVLVTGGSAPQKQYDQISKGVDILVATPGRLEDFIMSNQVSLKHCRFFVLDEADALLKQGQARTLEKMHSQIPKMTSDGRRLQMIVCSATLHDFEVKKLADRLMHFPIWVDLKGEDSVPDTVHHIVVPVDPKADLTWKSCQNRIKTDGVHQQRSLGNVEDEQWSESVKLLKVLFCVNAIERLKMDRALIFCRTKLDCDNLEIYLKTLSKSAAKDDLAKAPPYSCVCLHSDRGAAERNANLECFKQEKVRFLICTDVACRGIDIKGLPFIINMTLPDDKTNYVHRIGRVGRAERMGLAISLVSTCQEKVWYHGQWCKSHGKNCFDTNKCCIWQNEMQYLSDIEDHLKVTITQVGPEMNVPQDEFDGKVTYGDKKVNQGSGYKDHVELMAPAVRELALLERQAQILFLNNHKVKCG
ncbi:ATP-dependent RNA helicase Ddx1 [Cloeon dipterum]|uniref:ATP-dependent RNA helicase Ddx1 n=1 Tax=Cloeon dipterum TaxID=197152 RepID=UPI00321F6DB2